MRVSMLEQHLQQYEGTVIAVTPTVTSGPCSRMDSGADRGEGIPWKGNYSIWLEQKTKRMEMEEKVASKRRKTLNASWIGCAWL